MTKNLYENRLCQVRFRDNEVDTAVGVIRGRQGSEDSSGCQDANFTLGRESHFIEKVYVRCLL